MPEDGGLIDQALIVLKPVNAWAHTYTKPQTSSTRSRGLGWRIHESVEDTKLSTNKQHTLSKALLQAEIQSSKNQLDSMAKKQTRRCEHQAKRQEAQEYLRDKKGPSKFCGNTHSLQMPKELVLGMPMGVLWINQDPTTTEEAMEK